MSIFHRKPAASPDTAAAEQTIRDRHTYEPLPQREQPGYYPGFSTLAQEKFWDAATRLAVHHRLSASHELRFFSAEEAATMLAVTARILPQEDRTPERRIAILPGIDKRLFTNKLEGYRFEDMPPDQEAYRIAARAFEQMAQESHSRSFHQLSTLEQEELLRSVHDGKPRGAYSLWKQLNVERFWAMLVSDCCAVYYAHPWAWDEVGFGGPAYPRGYMRLEEGEPEPWEVNEQRYEWLAPADTLSDAEEHQGSGAEHQTHHGAGGTH